MDDLRDFERFEPLAWQDHGLLRPLTQKKKRLVPRRQPLRVIVAVSILGAGFAANQTFAFTRTASECRQSIPISWTTTEVRQRFGPDIDKRIRDIAELKQGWYDGEGAIFDRSSLAKLRALIQQIPKNVPWPYLYPAPNGEISAEWTFDDWEVELSFNPSMTRSTALAINTRTRDKERIEVWLDDANAASRLGRFVERFNRPSRTTS